MSVTWIHPVDVVEDAARVVEVELGIERSSGAVPVPVLVAEIACLAVEEVLGRIVAEVRVDEEAAERLVDARVVGCFLLVPVLPDGLLESFRGLEFELVCVR